LQKHGSSYMDPVIRQNPGMNEMHRSDLENRTIMITRPLAQAGRLCRLIETAGGKALLIPVLEIEALTGAADAAHIRSLLKDAEIFIFISTNAVHSLLNLDPGASGLLANRTIYAVGGATSRSLLENGLHNVLHAEGTGSESLLELPGLQQDRIHGRVISIVRGKGGRDYLRDQLETRGAQVNYLEVYQRRKPVMDDARLKNIWHQDRPDAIVISSVEGLQNLIDMTHPNDRSTLLKTPLVVISERLSAFALSCGFTSALKISGNASDDGLFAAVIQIFEERQ